MYQAQVQGFCVQKHRGYATLEKQSCPCWNRVQVSYLISVPLLTCRTVGCSRLCKTSDRLGILLVPLLHSLLVLPLLKPKLRKTSILESTNSGKKQNTRKETQKIADQRHDYTGAIAECPGSSVDKNSSPRTHE